MNVPLGYRRAIKFEYRYRDADNWKTWGDVTFATNSKMSTKDLFLEIRNWFDEEDFFIAHQIGIPEVFPEDWATGEPAYRHHVWHQFVDFEEGFLADAVDTPGSLEDFIDRVRTESKKGWLDTWVPGGARPTHDEEKP